MKSKTILLIAASATMLLFPLCNPQATALDIQPGYNSQYTQTYTYNATNSGAPQYNGKVQNSGSTPYTVRPVAPRQPFVAQQTVAPRGTYQATLPNSTANRQIKPSSKRKLRRKTVKSARVHRANQWQQRPVARQYPPAYAAQPRPAVRRGYNQWPQTGYYSNPYQARTRVLGYS